MFPPDTPIALAHLIERCWEQKPKKRPIAADAVSELKGAIDSQKASAAATSKSDAAPSSTASYRGNLDSTQQSKTSYRGNLSPK